MGFSNSVIDQAWHRAGGASDGTGFAYCECCRTSHGHSGRCNKRLVKSNRGPGSGSGAWEAHHKLSRAAGGGDTAGNCEIVCVDCHTEITTLQNKRR
jgi:hypothetical protein